MTDERRNGRKGRKNEGGEIFTSSARASNNGAAAFAIGAVA
jgi:hypothetical protein